MALSDSGCPGVADVCAASFYRYADFLAGQRALREEFAATT